MFVLYPCDIGVERNGGRAGARWGPAKFLHFLRRMGSVDNAEWDVDLSGLTLSYYTVDTVMETNDDDDDGDDDSLTEVHRRLTAAVKTVLQNGGLPIVIGGGNDQSVANWRALVQSMSTSRQ